MNDKFKLASNLTVSGQIQRELDALRYEQEVRNDLAIQESPAIIDEEESDVHGIEQTEHLEHNLLHDPKSYPRMSKPEVYEAGWRIIDMQESIINDMLDEAALVLAFQKIYANIADRTKLVSSVTPRGPDRGEFCKKVFIKGKAKNRQDHDKMRLGCGEIAQECETFVLDILTAPTLESLRKPKRALATKLSTLFLKDEEWEYLYQLTASASKKKSGTLKSIVKASPLGEHITFDTKKLGKIAENMAIKLEAVEKARDLLYKGNLGIVTWTIQKKLHLDCRDPDIFQNGANGLISAVKVWHPANGTFGSVALPWLRQSILQHHMKHSRAIRLPIQAHELLMSIDRINTNYMAQTGNKPSTEELVKLTGNRLENIEFVLPHLHRMASLDKPIGNDDDSSSTLLEAYKDTSTESTEDKCIRKAMETDVNDFVNGLKGKDLEVIKRRFGFGCDPETLEEIGQSLSISRERVRQIEVRALNLLKLRARSNKKIASYNPNCSPS